MTHIKHSGAAFGRQFSPTAGINKKPDTIGIKKHQKTN
jgi:hypothetical protein